LNNKISLSPSIYFTFISEEFSSIASCCEKSGEDINENSRRTAGVPTTFARLPVDLNNSIRLILKMV
jgi:hypothetical protein